MLTLFTKARLHSMSENSRYTSNTESVVDVVTHDPRSVRSLNMKHKVYFPADERQEKAIRVAIEFI